MAAGSRVSPVARVLLVLGAAVLLYSLFLPWFTVTGTRPELPAGTYTGVGSTELLNSLAKGPWAWIGFGWLLVCSIVAIAVAAVGRRTHNFGTSGILVLVLYAILLLVAANLVNQQAGGSNAGISFAYGFVGAIAGSALIEAGSRFPRPARAKVGVPAGAAGKERA
jgi:hypothetical protein